MDLNVHIKHKWKTDFNLSDDHLREVVQSPHAVALECYVKAFQYKVLNNILYTNKKLFKIGYRADDVCTFCEAEPETLYHILYQFPYSRQFWNDFESYWCLLSNQQVRLSLQNVIFGIISKQCPSTTLINYFIIVGTLFLWDCRRNQIHPKIKGYQNKIVKKYETDMEPEDIAQRFRILRKCQNKSDCLIFEMFFIKELKPTLNKQCDSVCAKLFV